VLRKEGQGALPGAGAPDKSPDHHMSDRDLDRLVRFRPKLIDELNGIDGLSEIAAEDSQPVQLDQQSVGRLSRMDAIQRQAMAAETKRRRQRRRLQILQALRRMDENEFGYCTNCGEVIPDGRLDVDAAFHLCVICADAAF
jgi:DnaK suppressor protein